MPFNINKYVNKSNKKFRFRKIFPKNEFFGSIVILFTAITNLKLYNRWVRMQYLIADQLNKKEGLAYENHIKQQNIKKFSLRRKPKLLKFYKNLKTFEKIIKAIFTFLIQAILIILSIIIVLIIIFWLWGWISSNPLLVIIILLIMILLKK